eukprot:4130029-Alexandrium_andersonii.AAC.1
MDKQVKASAKKYPKNGPVMVSKNKRGPVRWLSTARLPKIVTWNREGPTLVEKPPNVYPSYLADERWARGPE